MNDEPLRHLVRGTRLYLRDVLLSDVNQSYLRWMNDPEVNQYLESRFSTHSIESLTEFVRSMQHSRDNVFLAMVLSPGDRHIGNIKLGPINPVHKFGTVGLLIGEKDCWGAGYATEAITLLKNLAFEQLELRRLTAGCYGNNEASAKAFLKAGFQVEGRRPGQFYCDGKFVDQILLGVTRPEPGLDLKDNR